MAKTKKKLNKKVLFAALAAVVIGSSGLFALVRLRTYVDPLETNKKIDEAVAAGDYPGAKKLIDQLTRSDNTNATALVRYSQIMSHLTSFEQTNMQFVRGGLANAIAANPTYEPALQAQVELTREYLLLGGRTLENLRELKSQTDQLLLSNPANALGKLARAQVIAEGLSVQAVTPGRAEVDQANRDLKKFREENPAEPEFIHYQAMGMIADFLQVIRETPQSRTSELPARAIEIRDELTALAGELAIFGAAAAAPTTRSAGPVVNFQAGSRATELYLQLLNLYASDRPKQQELLTTLADISEQVVNGVPVSDPKAFMILQTQSAINRLLGRVAVSQKAAERMKEVAPADWTPRINLAETLAAQGKSAEAVAELEVELPPSYSLISLRGQMHEPNATTAAFDRARYRDDVILNSQPGVERDALILKQQKDLDLLSSRLGESSAMVLQIRAGQQLVRRELNESLQSINRAIDLTPLRAGDMRTTQLRQQLERRQIYLLIQLGQNGRARQILLDMIARAPGDLQARLQLGELYARDGEAAAAKEQIAIVLGVDPNNAIGQRLMTLVSRDDTKLRKDSLDKLPELTAVDLDAKLRIAIQIGETNEAVRLGEALVQQKPGESQPVQMLAQALVQNKEQARAIELVNAFLVTAPSDQQMALLRDQISAQTPEDRQKLQDKLLDNVTDPVQKALIQAMRAQAAGDQDAYLAKLKEADALDTVDGSSAERLLEIYSTKGDWDQAEVITKKLTQLNRDRAGGRLYAVQLLLARAQASKTAEESSKYRDQALVIAREAVTRFPDFAGGHVALARVEQFNATFATDIAVARKSLSDAAASYTLALDRQPTNLLALRGAVETMVSLPDQVAKAKPLIEQGMRIAPQDEFFKEAALRYELTFGDATKVIEPRKQMLEQYPTNRQNWRELARAYETNAVRARAKLDEKAAQAFTAQSLDVYKRGLEKFPDDLEFARNFAALSIAAGNAQQGIDAFERVANLDKFKNDPQVLMVRSELLSGAGKAADAILLLQSSLISSGNNPQLRIRLAQLMFTQQRLDSGLDVLRQGQENSMVAQTLIETLANLGRLDEAKKLVEESLAKSRTPEMLNQAGFVALRANEPAKAIEYFTEVLNSRPKDVAALYFRSTARRADGNAKGAIDVPAVLADLQAARREMEEARRQGRPSSPMEPDVRLQTAMLLRQTARNEDAIAELESALLVVPEDRRIVIELARTYAQQLPPRWAKVEEVLAAARQKPGLVNDPDVIFEQADMWATRNDTGKAVASSRQALAAAPGSPGVVQKHQQILLRVGANRELVADSDKYSAELRDLWWVRAGRALALLRTQNKDAALVEIDRAIAQTASLDPQQAPVAVFSVAQSVALAMGSNSFVEKFKTQIAQDNSYRLLAMTVALGEANLASAIQSSDGVLNDSASTPDQRAQAHALLGAYALSGEKPDLAVARTRYEQAIALNSTNMEYLNNLAYVLSLSDGTDDRKRGLGYAKTAYDLSVKASGGVAADPLIADTYGWLLLLNNDIQQGMDVLNQALIRREIPEVSLHLAEGYIMQKQPGEAVRMIEKTLALMERMRSNGQRMDPGLRGRVDDAKRRADQLFTSN